jgi:DGQHR domain-containing protein
VKFTYLAIKVVQTPNAEPFYLLQSRADQLLEWCDVPRKKESFMAGYQRTLTDRHEEIRKFIERDPKNIIPGAVIVAVTRDAVTVTPTALPDLFQLTIDATQQEFSERLKRMAADFYNRLNEEEKLNADAMATKMLGAPEAEVLAEGDADEESDEPEDDIPPKSYLALLAAELKVASTDIERLPSDRQQSATEYVMGMTKPGLILDGQHRAFGAKNVVECDVFLPVVVLPGLDVSEQVFHFYVLNNKAVPLKPTELRATISTSLTNHEIDQLYKRFKLAGVKAEKARLTHRANTDAASPFKDLIDFGFADSSAFLPENVMFQVIAAFVDMPRKYRMLYKEVSEWTGDAHYDYRLSLFYHLWDAVRDKYPQAWESGIHASLEDVKNGARQIFMKASVLVLQTLLLDGLVQDQPKRTMRNELSPLGDPDTLYQEIKSALYFLPEEFFTRVWLEKQLDTTERRSFLYEQMKLAIRNQGKKLGYQPLFTPQGYSGGHRSARRDHAQVSSVL